MRLKFVYIAIPYCAARPSSFVVKGSGSNYRWPHSGTVHMKLNPLLRIKMQSAVEDISITCVSDHPSSHEAHCCPRIFTKIESVKHGFYQW